MHNEEMKYNDSAKTNQKLKEKREKRKERESEEKKTEYIQTFLKQGNAKCSIKSPNRE